MLSASQEPTEAERLSTSFRKAARKALPTAVTVCPPAKSAEGDVEPRPRIGPSRREGSGSGVVIDATRGLILTNDHVVAGYEQALVILHDGRERLSTRIRRDPRSDLAVISIAPGGLTEAAWGDSDAIDVGDWVLAVGQPFGLSGSVTAGIVSGKGRGIDSASYEDLIQTDAAINPGNSGGPLINLKGEIVGINTALKTVNGGYEGVGFAVPSKRAKRVASDLAEFGRVRRAYLGISVRRVEPDRAERLGEPGATLITTVSKGGPAADAGLLSGDAIVRFRGEPVEGPGPLQDAIEAAKVGEPLNLTIDRDGKRLEVRVIPRSLPER